MKVKKNSIKSNYELNTKTSVEQKKPYWFYKRNTFSDIASRKVFFMVYVFIKPHPRLVFVKKIKKSKKS